MADATGPQKFMTSIRVGPKGQVVIPKEVRTMFGIQPGDSVLLLADSNRGIAIQRLDHFDRIADEIFSGETSSDAELNFAQAVKRARGETE